jgi:hypothetical protein
MKHWQGKKLMNITTANQDYSNAFLTRLQAYLDFSIVLPY